MNLLVKAALAGVLFSLWPLLMKKSGLSGNVSSAVFSLGALVILVPVALFTNGIALPAANWTIAVFACIPASVGLLLLNSMVEQASPQELGSLMVLMIVVQIVTPALYSVFQNGGLSLSKACGFIMAGIVAVLLTK